MKAKENGFILIGKTGTGKTSLLNIMFGDDVGKVGYSTQSETKNTNYYYIKENIGNKSIYFSNRSILFFHDKLDIDGL